MDDPLQTLAEVLARKAAGRPATPAPMTATEALQSLLERDEADLPGCALAPDARVVIKSIQCALEKQRVRPEPAGA